MKAYFQLLRNSPLTLLLWSACLVVTVPTIFDRDFYQVFGGEGQMNFWWQPLTSTFQHGFLEFNTARHLIGNSFLILIVGPLVERLFGAARMLLLVSVSIALYLVGRPLTGLQGNGSSIWFWGFSSIIFVADHHAQQLNLKKLHGYRRWVIHSVLWLMWLVLPLFFGIMLPFRGAEAPFWMTITIGNLYHATATFAGALFVWLFHDRVQEEAATSEATATTKPRRSLADYLAIVAGVMWLTFLIGIHIAIKFDWLMLPSQ